MNLLSVTAILLAVAVLAFFWVRKASMTQGLVLANFLVFLFMLFTGDFVSIRGTPLLDDLAFRTDYVTEAQWGKSYTIFTAAFLHADFFHVLANMLILLLAGLPFEERLGRGRYLVVYFFSAVAAVLLHVLWNEFATTQGVIEEVTGRDMGQIPVVGASGAVFGVLGGFAATYPRDQIPMIIPPFILPIRMPVVLAAIVYSLVEIVALFVGGLSPVAHAAHIGGAVGGAMAAPLLKPPERRAGEVTPGRKLDYEKLRGLAKDDASRRLVDRVQENSDHIDVQRAWLDRLFVALRCPECGQGYSEVGAGTLECDNGHRESYVSA